MKIKNIFVLALIILAGNTLFGQVDVLPDFVSIWRSYSLQDIRIDSARSNDRLVSCEDWTLIDPNPIEGQPVLSFTLGSPNFGQGHFRTRRVATDEGWVFYQTTSQVDGDGNCTSIERQIAVVPQGQPGRWLPLASFSLYEVTDDGGVGARVVCQMKRWCCLVSSPTCTVNPPCSLPVQGDGINAGARDVYPFHWLDQFIPIDGVPSGLYWVEHRVNPANIFIESNYDNNSMMFKIMLDQEAGSVTVVEEPVNPGDCP